MHRSAPLALTIVALAGCGAARSRPFDWLVPSRPPAGWTVLRTAGAELAFPPGWKQAHADSGAATATLQTGNVFHGYLNVTPAQGDERVAGWAAFRIAHNREEGDKHVTLVSERDGLRFRGGRGSCVIDDYQAKVGTVRYREIACFVTPARGGSVVIAATPAAEVSQRIAVLEQAVSHFAVH